MKMKRNKRMSLSLIFILIIATVLIPLNHILASNSSSELSGNSGGFIIETAKVDGSMDLLGALTGNITIHEGEIHGLTITKVMERGEGLEPLVVRITSPGPIPVKNLNAQTINNELPNIGGLCKPSELGRICMENVVMNVEEQFVESISLINANVHTCYVSECGSLPNYIPLLSLEQLEELLKGNEQVEDLSQTIIDLIKEQEGLLEQLETLLIQATDLINELLNQDYIETLLEKISKTEKAILGKLGLDQLLPSVESINLEVENLKKQLITLTGLLGDSSLLIEEIEKNIAYIEEQLAEYESLFEEKVQLQNKFDTYNQLIELAELQEAGKPLEYSQTEEEDIDELDTIHDLMDNLNDKFENQKKRFNEINANVDDLQTGEESLEGEVKRLKGLLDELGLGGENTDGGLLDGVLDPVEESVLDPVKEKLLDPALDPIEESVLDPVKENVLDPVLDPVKENVLDPVLDPVEENILDPIKEEVLDPVLDPIKEDILEPILDPVTGKLIDPITGKVVDLIVDPVSENLLDPLTRKVIIPILNPLTGKITNPMTGEVVKQVYNQETGEVLDPYKDGFLKRLLKKLLNPFG